MKTTIKHQGTPHPPTTTNVIPLPKRVRKLTAAQQLKVKQVQAAILSAANVAGVVLWEDIGKALVAAGMKPRNWLTEVRGPLQALLDTKQLYRDLGDVTNERYGVRPFNHVAPQATSASAFAAIASTLTQEETAAAGVKAKAAINKAKGNVKPAPSVKPADTAQYVCGAYKGRAGAMFDFMKRCAALGESFTRETAVASCTKKPPHAKVATRAQVLDYFAWAVRHSLLVEAEANMPAAGGKQPKRSATPAPERSAAKRAKPRKAAPVSALLTPEA